MSPVRARGPGHVWPELRRAHRGHVLHLDQTAAPVAQFPAGLPPTKTRGTVKGLLHPAAWVSPTWSQQYSRPLCFPRRAGADLRPQCLHRLVQDTPS